MKEIYVDTPELLTQLCTELSGQDTIAIDTEFLREKTYYAQLCLLQIAGDGIIACIDPIQLSNIQPLLDIIYDKSVTKVLHAARQDLEIFYDINGTLPLSIFDTQIAAALLGSGDQMGYANLVNTMLGVSLDKSQTRTNWSLRPLDKKQVQYAMDDVRYLLEIYRQQKDQLVKFGRDTWLENDFSNLSNVALYHPPADDLWQKVKGYKTLKGVQFVILQALAKWRDSIARKTNRPRRWIIRDDVLIEIARHHPESRSEIEKVRGWEGGLQRYSEAILSIIEEAKRKPAEDWPKISRANRLTQEQESLVDAMMAVVRLRASQNNIAASVLTGRKELERLVLGEKDCSVNFGWRFAMIGNDLADLMSGDIKLRFKDKVLQIE
jgi:ribonuclease D